MLMIGYFLVESKSVGRNIRPYRSVLPSAAFTRIGIGGFQPAASSFVTSARSSGISTLPVPGSRSTTTGGWSGVDQVSTRYFPSGESCAPCRPASGVSQR